MGNYDREFQWRMMHPRYSTNPQIPQLSIMENVRQQQQANPSNPNTNGGNNTSSPSSMFPANSTASHVSGSGPGPGGGVFLDTTGGLKRNPIKTNTSFYNDYPSNSSSSPRISMSRKDNSRLHALKSYEMGLLNASSQQTQHVAGAPMAGGNTTNASYMTPLESATSTYGYTLPPPDNYADPLQEYGSNAWLDPGAPPSSTNNNGNHSPPRAPSGSTIPPASSSLPLPHGQTTSAFNSLNSMAISELQNPGRTTAPAVGSSPASSLFGVDQMLPDYETGFYSLWNGSNGGNVMNYEPEPENDRQQQQPTATPTAESQLYMPEEELKMDYAQMPELSHGELEYLCGPVDASNNTGNGSGYPNAPANTGAGAMLPTAYRKEEERRTASEPHVERLISSSDMMKPRGDRLADKPKVSTGTTRGIYTRRAATTTTSNYMEPVAYRGYARNMTGYEQSKRPITSTGMDFPPPAPRNPLSSVLSSDLTSSNMNAANSNPPPPMPTQPSNQQAPPMISTSRPQTRKSTSSSTSKRPRSRQCDYPGCTNRARSHQKCKKHGGAHQCVFEGCTKNSQSRGLCIAHGGGSRCKVEGCTRASQSKGLCKSHGGGEFCAVEGCRKKAHLKHLCRTHGGGVRCKSPKCTKWAQRKGWCMAHAKEFLGT